MKYTVETVFKYSDHPLADIIEFGEGVDAIIITSEDGRLCYAEDFFSVEDI